jgi:hypothetical protein
MTTPAPVAQRSHTTHNTTCTQTTYFRVVAVVTCTTPRRLLTKRNQKHEHLHNRTSAIHTHQRTTTTRDARASSSALSSALSLAAIGASSVEGGVGVSVALTALLLGVAYVAMRVIRVGVQPHTVHR